MPEDNNNDINNPHDSGYKYLLYSKKAFVQLIRSFVKTGWADKIDEASLVRIDKSFILQDFKDKEADVVYTAKLKDQEVIFYVLMELQSTVDYLIPYRLLLYMTEIWRDIFKNVSENEAKRKSFRLPVIVPMVLYNGDANWSVPIEFKDTLGSADLFEDNVLNFKYILFDVQKYEEEELLQLSNLIGSVFLVDKSSELEDIIEQLKKLISIIKNLEAEEFNLFTNWAQKILTRDVPSNQKDKVTNFLKDTRPEEVEEMITNVERILKKSWEEAENTGVKKRNIEIARQMLSKDEPIENIMEYTGLSEEELEKLK